MNKKVFKVFATILMIMFIVSIAVTSFALTPDELKAGTNVTGTTEITNLGEEAQGLEYVSSFALNGIDKEGLEEFDEKMELWIPHNGWQKELCWQIYTLKELGLSVSQPKIMHRSSKTIGIGNTGNWSTKEYIPMGYIHNREMDASLFWQIEHNGSWYWEISDQDGQLIKQLKN